MKTPLEEFIEIIKNRQKDDGSLPFMYNTQIIELAESLLKKTFNAKKKIKFMEKFQIILESIVMKTIKYLLIFWALLALTILAIKCSPEEKICKITTNSHKTPKQYETIF